MSKRNIRKSVREASDLILLKYECPADTSEGVRIKRASFGLKYYTKFATNQNKEVVVGYIAFAKGTSMQLSKHFHSTEFDCHGNGCCSETKVNEKLIEILEQIREHFDAPITVTSAYRCPTHNRRIGGVTGSRHSKADAADIVVKGVAPRIVAQYAESIGVKGIGLYESSKDGYFVHVDTRDVKSFWYGQSEQPRTTFGTYTNMTSPPPISVTGNNLNTILNLGDTGDDVKKLQEKLTKLGYTCSADGIFGKLTEAAVRMFQEKANIGVDGIAGSQTLAAIDKAIKALSADDSDGKSVKITASALNVRSGPGKNYPAVTYIRNGAVCKVVEEKDGWGRISSPAGWISGQYYEEI